jgi:Zn-dependent protease
LPSGALVVAIFKFVLLLFSLCVHECAHAWMASRLGDQTAREMGRVSLNPMDHIDPLGTLLFPALMIFGPLWGMTLFGGVLFGWAKPTPVITRNFRKIVRDDNLTTLAGPFSNLLIVFVAVAVLAIILLVVPDGPQYVEYAFSGSLLAGEGVSSGVQATVLLAKWAIIINLSLFFFNLLPIPPLDGSRLLRNMLPYNAVQTYDRIPTLVSYLLMIVIGPVMVAILLRPSLALVSLALSHL